MVKRFGSPRRTRIIRPDQIDDVSLGIDDPEGMTDDLQAVTLTASASWVVSPRELEAGDARAPRRRGRVHTTTMSKVMAITSAIERSSRPPPRSPRSAVAREVAGRRGVRDPEKASRRSTLAAGPTAPTAPEGELLAESAAATASRSCWSPPTAS